MKKLVPAVMAAVILSTSPVVAEAARPPWTITTQHGEVDEVHSKPHKGLDFAVRMNTPLASLTDGTVIRVKDDGRTSYGKFIRIQDEQGRIYTYGHLSKQLVKEGDKVRAGQTIALTGNSGHSTGPHLHFQVNVNGKAVDPMPIIKEQVAKKSLFSSVPDTRTQIKMVLEGAN